MIFITVMALWAVALFGVRSSPLAIELNTITPLEKRSVCDGVGATGVLDHSYTADDCPARYSFSPDGVCNPNATDPDGSLCSYFCQVRTKFTPMQEFPIPHTYCRGPRTCSIGDTMGPDVGIQYDGAEEYRRAFEDGISGGFFGRKENVHMKGASVDIEEGQCGYFAWIGTKREVCGSLTEPVDPGHCTGPKKTTQNVCVEDIFTGPLGIPDNYAATVFVYLDCNTRLPLPADQQSYLFGYDGVAFDTNLLDSLLQADVATECTMKNNFLWYAWSMKGRGLKDDKLGHSGSGLLANIRHCGVDITGWTFKYTPGDTNYDWHASGNISPFTMACPGKALKETGGNSANC